jgi:hypothetical protein
MTQRITANTITKRQKAMLTFMRRRKGKAVTCAELATLFGKPNTKTRLLVRNEARILVREKIIHRPAQGHYALGAHRQRALPLNDEKRKRKNASKGKPKPRAKPVDISKIERHADAPSFSVSGWESVKALTAALAKDKLDTAKVLAQAAVDPSATSIAKTHGLTRALVRRRLAKTPVMPGTDWTPDALRAAVEACHG